MHIDTYRSVLAGHELVEFDYVKRRVGSQAILASHELSAIGIDTILNLPDDEYAALRALDDDSMDQVTADPGDDAELAFNQEVHERFDTINGYVLSFASTDEGLSLVKILHDEEGMLTVTITLSCSVSPDGTPDMAKTRRGVTMAGDKVRESLEVTEDDKRILEEAFARLASIDEELKDA